MTMSQQIIMVLDDLCRRLGIAVDWSAENVIPYLQELAGKYISWEIATSWAWIVIGGILIAFGLLLIYYGLTVWNFGLAITVGVIIGLIGICTVGDQTFDIITCKYLPEKMIVEYISMLMKTTG